MNVNQWGLKVKGYYKMQAGVWFLILNHVFWDKDRSTSMILRPLLRKTGRLIERFRKRSGAKNVTNKRKNVGGRTFRFTKHWEKRTLEMKLQGFFVIKKVIVQIIGFLSQGRFVPFSSLSKQFGLVCIVVIWLCKGDFPPSACTQLE